MDTRPLLFLDSGIGGIPYCRDFQLRNPGEPLIYLADRAHFPYGKRRREELARIVPALIEALLEKADPKIAVIACNTATVSVLKIVREKFPRISFVGTVPAVKPAVLDSRSGVVGVLGTGRTIGDPYTGELARKYRRDCRIRGIAAPELVEFIERRYGSAGEDEKREMALTYVNKFRAAGADAIVLGCTHFLFLLDEFRREAAPDIRVYDSLEGISRRIESLLDRDGGRLRSGGLPSGGFSVPERRAAGDFLITGDAEPEAAWGEWAGRLGLRLSLLKRYGAPGLSRTEGGA
ncbi:MAG: glutamate racemase [Treponema sp.]|jgi:glutamate racemase|nr:glutamate racemase [Treponema sp.]